MNTTKRYLACDLGAESGRLMLGTLADGKLSLEELHRFPNTPLEEAGSLHWDIPQLFEELKTGLTKAAARRLPVASISTDSWGVDYLLYDEQGRIIAPTFHYRDERCPRGVEAVYGKMKPEEVFDETGLQFLPFNTLFQLAAETPERLGRARLILGIGDGFNYWLSGAARYEESLASTTQLYNPKTKVWSERLLELLDLPAAKLAPVVASGTRLGGLKAELAAATGLEGVEVVASCSHDTGAAVAAVPGEGSDWAYLSSGTWSLMGVEQPEPVVNQLCRDLNFTNEIGYGGSVRLLKNLVGLWIVQECRREWARRGEEYDYAALTRMAEAAPPFVSQIDPADERFLSPGDMPDKVAAYCRETGQGVPETPGTLVRCILESLALLYGRTLRQLEELVGRRMSRLHIVGGGSRNALLNQFAANALRRPVHTGPVEATAAGNILVQALALGDLPSLGAAREIIRRSFEMGVFTPQEPTAWEDATARFDTLTLRA